MPRFLEGKEYRPMRGPIKHNISKVFLGPSILSGLDGGICEIKKPLLKVV